MEIAHHELRALHAGSRPGSRVYRGMRSDVSRHSSGGWKGGVPRLLRRIQRGLPRAGGEHGVFWKFQQRSAGTEPDAPPDSLALRTRRTALSVLLLSGDG